MGVKVVILDCEWSKLVEKLHGINIIGKVCVGAPVTTSVDTREFYWVSAREGVGAAAYCLKIGVQIALYKEAIFTDKEYEELWV